MENPNALPLLFRTTTLSWTPTSKLSFTALTPGIVFTIFNKSLDAFFKVSKSFPFNLTSTSLPGGPPRGALIISLFNPETFSTFSLQTFINSFVLTFLFLF